MPKLNLVKARVISTLSDLESFKRESTLKVLKFAEEHRCNMERIASTLEARYADIETALGEGFAVESEIDVLPETPAAPASTPAPLPQLKNLDLAQSVLEALPLIGTEKAAILAERIMLGAMSRKDLTKVRYALKSIFGANPKLYKKEMPKPEELVGPLQGDPLPAKDLASFIDEVTADKELTSLINKFNDEVTSRSEVGKHGAVKYWCPLIDLADIADARNVEYNRNPQRFMEATERQRELYEQLVAGAQNKFISEKESEDAAVRETLPTFKQAAFQDSTGAVRMIPDSIAKDQVLREKFTAAWDEHLDIVYASVSKAREKLHSEYSAALAAEKAAEAAGNTQELAELRKSHERIKDAMRRQPAFDGKYKEFTDKFLTSKFSGIDLNKEWTTSLVNVIADEEIYSNGYVLTDTERDYLYKKIYESTDEAYKQSLTAGEVPSTALFMKDLRDKMAPTSEIDAEVATEAAPDRELDRAVYREVLALIRAAHPDNIDFSTGKPYTVERMGSMAATIIEAVKAVVTSAGEDYTREGIGFAFQDSFIHSKDRESGKDYFKQAVGKLMVEKFPADSVPTAVYERAIKLATTLAGKNADEAAAKSRAFMAVSTIATTTGRTAEITDTEITNQLHSLYAKEFGEAEGIEGLIPVIKDILSEYHPDNVNPRTGTIIDAATVRGLAYDVLQYFAENNKPVNSEREVLVTALRAKAWDLKPFSGDVQQPADSPHLAFIKTVLASPDNSPLGAVNPHTGTAFTADEIDARAQRILAVYTAQYAKLPLDISLVHRIVAEDATLNMVSIPGSEIVERHGLDSDAILIAILEDYDKTKSEKMAEIEDYVQQRVDLSGAELVKLLKYYEALIQDQAPAAPEPTAEEPEVSIVDIRHQEQSNALPYDEADASADESDEASEAEDPGLGHRGSSWLRPETSAGWCFDCLPSAAALKPAVPVSELAAKHDLPESKIEKDLALGAEVEREHTDEAETAEQIASHHEDEIAGYYGDWLLPMEAEAKEKSE
jgi:hypothetical protein